MVDHLQNRRDLAIKSWYVECEGFSYQVTPKCLLLVACSLQRLCRKNLLMLEVSSLSLAKHTAQSEIVKGALSLEVRTSEINEAQRLN